MSARRAHGQSYADVAASSPPEKSDSDVTPVVPAYEPKPSIILILWSNIILCRDVIYKLLGFTAAMVVGPIGMYFLTVNSIFGGKQSLTEIVKIFQYIVARSQ